MRRFFPILLLAFCMFLLLSVGTMYLSSSAGKVSQDQREQVIVYTTLPVEHIALLTQEYERTNQIRVRLVPVDEDEIASRMQQESANPQADLVLGSQGTLEKLRLLGFLKAVSTEQTDIIPAQFKDPDQYWTGLWFDPIVFTASRDSLLSSKPLPSNWSDLGKQQEWKVSMTDFLAADASANLLYTLTMDKGELQTLALLRDIHPRVIKYAKFLSTPVRMVGMGECDLAVAVQSETMRYQAENFPVIMIYPEDGTAYLLTGGALIKDADQVSESLQFLDWLLQHEAHLTLEKNGYYFTSVNPELKKYRDYRQQEVKVFRKGVFYTPEERRKLLDKWVQTVRLTK